MVCATAVVLVAIQQELCDSTTILIFVAILFGGEQAAKAWIQAQVDSGSTNSVPAVLLKWYRLTEGPK
jgi:hypothetical protein